MLNEPPKGDIPLNLLFFDPRIYCNLTLILMHISVLAKLPVTIASAGT
jgi:hypothetical protein